MKLTQEQIDVLIDKCINHTSIITLHPQTKQNIEIDKELVPLIRRFWNYGGRSYCSCQSYVGIINEVQPHIIVKENNYIYFDEDKNFGMEGAFVIIHRRDMNLFWRAAKETGWKITYKEIGTGGYACEWIDNLPPDNKLLYLGIERK